MNRGKESDMGEENSKHYTGFAGHRRIASGALAEVVLKAREWLARNESASVIIFEDETGNQVHPELRGTAEEVLGRLAERSARETGSERAEETRRAGPGRPKLGVVSREVSLLPRHWEWLNAQPGGASVTLRKLVEEAKRNSQGTDKARHSQEAAYKFMHALAGDLPGFEEASRALFAKKHERFEQLIHPWPEDVREHLRRLVAIAIRDEQEATRKP